MSGVQYIKTDLLKHPQCVHGPTFLFSKRTKNGESKFFACSACRDRKGCPFFLHEGDKFNNEIMKEKQLNYTAHINHQNLSSVLSEINKIPEDERLYCHICNKFIINDCSNHKSHKISTGITEKQLLFPSTWLEPKENDKKEAQYLFSDSAVTTVINILKDQNLVNIICIGTPRIHEYIKFKCKDMRTILLDIDERYHNFYKPEEYCWYNLFNHYFFKEEAKQFYLDFLKQDNGEKTALLIDPPFGGRTEPVSQTIHAITKENKAINSSKKMLPILFFMPYFMEQHIKNHIPELQMADYKVDYDNHSLFTSGPKGRKRGSPVRIFTNINLSTLNFYNDDYRYCQDCEKYVYKENKHCFLCNSCTSKDGSTYVHCNKCNRCVRPSWVHCNTCKKCVIKDHKCGEEETFEQSCFHCHEKGHKKSECPKINVEDIKRKRKQKFKKNKRFKNEKD